MKPVFIALGSNLQNPIRQIRSALVELQGLPNSVLVKTSSLYRTAPMGPEQPDFINAAVQINTSLSAMALLAELQSIENLHGRVRAQHWGPRTLDLDLLLYGDEIIVSEQLVIPHPGMKARAFVLYPLLEIAPDLILPGGEAVSELAAQCRHDAKLSVISEAG